jgi:hypothetical protein
MEAYRLSFSRTVRPFFPVHFPFFFTDLYRHVFFPTGDVTAISKHFEMLVYRTMYDDLKNLISVNQHGFMKNRSTVTNLLENASFVLNSIGEGLQVDSVNTDFSKAFDRVRHQLLLEEMSVGLI